MSIEDEIVEEALRFLLVLVFEMNSLERTLYLNHTIPLNKIKSKFDKVNWCIKVDLSCHSFRFDHKTLLEVLKMKIEDQAFLDLVSKCLKFNNLCTSNIHKDKTFLSFQDFPFRTVLLEIYMKQFDHWIENELLFKIIKGLTVKDRTNYNSLQIYHIRYKDNIIIGVSGSKTICERVIRHCHFFLRKNLKFDLTLTDFDIICNQQKPVFFLNHYIHKLVKGSLKPETFLKQNKNIILDAPIDLVVEYLVHRGYAKKGGKPTRNGGFVNLSLHQIVQHYMKIERQILCYYCLVSNYDQLATRIHFILKYSCALTIASKMKLKTLRKVFSKYGKNLLIKNQEGVVIVTYSAVKTKNR